MKSRLLTRPELERLAEAGSVAGLVSALVKTAYRKPIESALTRFSGIDCIAHALREDLVDTFKKARSFFQAEAGAAVDTLLSGYDIQNLKAILRGLSRNVPPGEILNSLLPVGMFSTQQLSDLARSPGPRGVIDSLASLNLPQAQPLLRLRTGRPGAETQEMELALDQWYYQDALLSSSRKDPLPELLIAALQMEADLTNLFTVLRFVNNQDERKRLRERFGTDDLACLFVGPGKLSFAHLAQAGNQETLDLLVSQMAGIVWPCAGGRVEGSTATTAV
jgi:vacuolar-type H+-ATPase subunit C/Vma6